MLTCSHFVHENTERPPIDTKSIVKLLPAKIQAVLEVVSWMTEILEKLQVAW